MAESPTNPHGKQSELSGPTDGQASAGSPAAQTTSSRWHPQAVPAEGGAPTFGSATGVPSPPAPSLPETVSLPSPAPTEALPSAPGTVPEGNPGLSRVQVPGYEVLGVLGKGGMGIVYKARQVELGRLVALKMILRAEYAGAAERERFRSEAQAVARLDHPNIVQVYEVGEHDGLPFFSLEYCGGGCLADRLDGTPWPAARAAALVETLARAIHSAHLVRIVHRDLKPQNVLLTEQGEPKITDFGLAKKLDEQGQTQTGTILGTPSYMAPEQAAGKGKEVGPAADVYALGIILYELLAGRPPFKADTAVDTILQVVREEAVPLRQLQRRTPRDLETICQRCLQKQPAARYPSAHDLAEDLRRFQAGEPVTARPVGTVERGWRWCRRNPVVAALIALVAGTLVAGTGVATYFAVRATHGESRAVASEEKARASEERAVASARAATAARAESQHNLYFAEMNLVGPAASADSGQGRVNDLVGHWFPQPGEPDPRGWEWYFLLGLGRQATLTLHRHADTVTAVSWAPDGRLACGAADGTVRLWDPITGRLTTLPRRQAEEGTTAWSPDGRFLACGGADGTVRLWDADTGREVAVLRGHGRLVYGVCWSPDGRRLASASTDHTVRLWDAATGQPTAVLREHSTHVCTVSWSPDGRRLASGDANGEIRVWDVATGQGTLALKHFNWAFGVSWSPDGRRLASAGRDQLVRLWDADTCRELPPLRGHTDWVRAVAWSPDGRLLASGGRDQVIRLWDADSWQEVNRLRGHTGAIWSLSWGTDGRLASGGEDGTIRVWNVDRAGGNTTWRGHAGSVQSLAWSPDGKRLATGGLDQTVRVWDAVTGRPFALLPGHKGWVGTVAWSTEGRLASASRDDALVQLWDVETGRAIWTRRASGGGRASPDGRLLSFHCDDGTIGLWEAATGRETAVLRKHADKVLDVAWSTDGRLLASVGADRRLKVWDVATAREVLSVPTPEWPNAVCFSPDGTRLASGGYDQVVTLWDARSGRQIAALTGHTRRVMSLSWGPDGTRLASSGEDGTIRLWDPTTGREVLALQADPLGESLMSWSPDGRRLASAGASGTVKIWDASLGHAAAGSPALSGNLDGRLQDCPEGAAEWLLRAEVRARQGRWDEAAADWSHAAAQPGHATPWFESGWWVAGPLAADQSPAAPEDADLPAQDPAAPPAPVAGDEALAPRLPWRAVPPAAEGCLDLGTLSLQASAGFSHALLRVYSPAEQPAEARVGATGAWRCWLNGHLLQAGDPIPATEGKDVAVPLTLRAGWNTVQFRVALAGDPGRLYWRLADESTARVHDLCAAGQWPEAADRAAAAVARHPGRPDLLLLAARTARRQADRLRRQDQGEPADRAAGQARARYEELRALRPDDASLETEFADLLFSMPGPAGAPEWARLGRTNPAAFGGGRARLAAAHVLRGEWQAACSLLEKVPAPSVAERLLLARSLMGLCRHDEARRCCDAAIAAVAQSPAGEVLLPLAVDVVTGRLAREPKDAALWMQRARWLVDLGRLPEAIADFTQILQLDPDNLTALLWRGECLAREGAGERAAADGAAALRIDRAAALAWHRERLAGPERDRADLRAKVLHLDFLLPEERGTPDEAGLLYRRGGLHGRLRQWPQAAADFNRGLELEPGDHWKWYWSAVLRLQIGDGGGYRRHCQEVLRRFGDTLDRGIAERIAKTCALGPDGPAADPRLAKLAARASAGTIQEAGSWGVLARGLAEYRAGRPRAAIHWLLEGRGLILNSGNYYYDDPYCLTMMELVLALAHAQAKEMAPAREALGRAAALMGHRFPSEHSDLRNLWPDWLQCQILRREAETLLRPMGPERKE